MKLRLLLASCVIALAACATPGKNATDANVVQGLEATLAVARTLYQADQLTDDEAQAISDSLRAIHAFLMASRSAAAAGDADGHAAYLRAAADALDALTLKLAAKKGK
jgi:hypothetical protein